MEVGRTNISSKGRETFRTTWIVYRKTNLHTNFYLPVTAEGVRVMNLMSTIKQQQIAKLPNACPHYPHRRQRALIRHGFPVSASTLDDRLPIAGHHGTADTAFLCGQKSDCGCGGIPGHGPWQCIGKLHLHLTMLIFINSL